MNTVEPAVDATHRVVQGAVVQLNLVQVATSLFHCLLNGGRNFTGLTVTVTYTAVTITNHGQSGEGEDTTTFNNFS